MNRHWGKYYIGLVFGSIATMHSPISDTNVPWWVFAIVFIAGMVMIHLEEKA